MKTVLITGVSRGLGYALAEAYMAQGCAVYGLSRQTPHDLVDRGLQFVAADFQHPESLCTALDTLLPRDLSIDLAILNAAKLGEIKDMVQVSLADLRHTMEINLWANKVLLDCLLSAQRSVGQVIGVSSGASINGHRGWNGYSLSKAGLNMLIALYADEFPNTHFTALAPGLIDTAMQDYLTQLPSDPRYTPLERLKSAKGTELMPTPAQCAQRLISLFPQLQQLSSGAYRDIRQLALPE